MDYLNLKSLHMTLASVSIGGFIIRWAWMKSGSALSRHRLTRSLPHIIDTLFLASGIWLAVIIHQYPFTDSWLTAKIFGLLAYIALGALALKPSRSSLSRSISFLLSLLVVAWIVSVALSKNPWGALTLMLR